MSDLLAPGSPLVHLDDAGKPCASHPHASHDSLFALAMMGARASSFHHDIASKLQGIMMALDEISELVEQQPDADLRRATDTAAGALKELNQLLNMNRALSKPPARTRQALHELVATASRRVGVTVRGALPQTNHDVAGPAVTLAMTLVLDVAGGTGRARSVDITSAAAGNDLALTLTTSRPAPANAGESLAIAGWILGRDGGKLRCRPTSDTLVLHLPVAR
ncbi:MAG: hypothetical protein WKG01_11220 [Kofleriaceae bacterium]